MFLLQLSRIYEESLNIHIVSVKINTKKQREGFLYHIILQEIDCERKKLRNEKVSR